MNRSINYLFALIFMAVILSCAKEVLEPEQMISGNYALDDGSQVSCTYLRFEKGYVTKMVSLSLNTFADNYFWNCRESDFKQNGRSNYSIQNGELIAFGYNMGHISQDGDEMTLDGEKYTSLEGFNTECYSRIVLEKQSLDYLAKTVTTEVTIENPIKSGVLTASTKTSWISNVKITDNKTLSYTVSDTYVNRQGTITLSYTNALSSDVTISQEPATHIVLPAASGDVSYSNQTASFEYSIDNPVETSSLSVSCSASWVSNIQVKDNTVEFEVEENVYTSDRSAIFTMKYAGAASVTYVLTQKWASTSITTTPEEKEFTSVGGDGSFTFSIENPREGALVTVSSTDMWITGLTVSNNTVSYKVSERVSALPRSGKITLKYSNSYKVFATKDFVVNQKGAPVSLSLNKTNIALTAGEYENLVVSVTPSDAEIKWTSNHPEYAKVDANGKVTALDAGTATITVSAGDKTASCIVAVSDRENILSLSTSWNESTGLTYGNSGTITVSNPSGGALSISSQPSSSVATATLSGNKVTVTPLSSGETFITIKSAKTTGYAETAKMVSIKVLKATPVMTLSVTSLSLKVGGEPATVSVTTDSDGVLSASSSNTAVAAVTCSGKIVTVKSGNVDGNATITILCPETSKYKRISKDVSAIVYSDLVDLGLSVKWARCNLGASKPTEYGGYYRWAGTKDISHISISIDWLGCPYHTGSDADSGWSKYNTKSSYGTVDNKTVLEAKDDAATVALGGNWRIPTDEEWAELRNTDNCSWTWTSIEGVNGYKVQSKKSGYTDNWIFLPAAGYRGDYSLDFVGSNGEYWSSSLYTDNPKYAYFMDFCSSYVYRRYYGSRYHGLSIRPVSE